MKLGAGFLSVGLLLAALPRTAHGFERQWHIGAGAGISSANDLPLSPALQLYGAYGISDVFDARVELTARGYELMEDTSPYSASAMAGLAYKLDVIRWVPWAALYLGYQGFLSAPAAGAPFRQHDAAAAFGLGLDYAVSRELGLGVSLRYDQALSEAEGRSFDALLRAEYRWGW
jgi:hypothetical protein